MQVSPLEKKLEKATPYIASGLGIAYGIFASHYINNPIIHPENFLEISATISIAAVLLHPQKDSYHSGLSKNLFLFNAMAGLEMLTEYFIQ